MLLGSACEAGELVSVRCCVEVRQEEVARIVQFYDYLEIQPLGKQCVYAAQMIRNR